MWVREWHSVSVGSISRETETKKYSFPNVSIESVCGWECVPLWFGASLQPDLSFCYNTNWLVSITQYTLHYVYVSMALASFKPTRHTTSKKQRRNKQNMIQALFRQQQKVTGNGSYNTNKKRGRISYVWRSLSRNLKQHCLGWFHLRVVILSYH